MKILIISHVPIWVVFQNSVTSFMCPHALLLQAQSQLMCTNTWYHQGLLVNMNTNENYRHTSIFSLNYSRDGVFFEPKRISDPLEVTSQELQLTSDKGDQTDDAMNLLLKVLNVTYQVYFLESITIDLRTAV